jgi:hypothetical protein
MSNYYRRQADAFLELARQEKCPEVKLLFQELAEGYQMRADAVRQPQPITQPDVVLAA